MDDGYMEFDSIERAEEEKNDYSIVKKVKGYKATDKLCKETEQKNIESILCFDMLLTIYIENNTDFDGIWWLDKLDVQMLSAPRGVIFNNKLKEWQVISE